MGDYIEVKPENKLSLPFEENIEDLYENAPCGYISTLSQGAIVKVNDTFLRWTGYEREEILAGIKFPSLLSIGGQIFYETHVAPLLNMQGFINEINFDLVCKDGRRVPVLMNTIQYKNADNQVVLNRSTIFNITERKKYETELIFARKRAEELAKDKANFLSIMSHEIRTPLNAIIGVSNLLQKTKLSAQQGEYARILHLSSQNLLDLLNNILDFSKIDAGKATLNEQDFNIRGLLNDLAAIFKSKALEKNLTIVINIADEIPTSLCGDIVKIRQILVNLLSNALKFTQQGHISINLTAHKISSKLAHLNFIVKDTGIGIAPDRLATIFEEFTQADSSIGLTYGGTGLGLAVSQKLLELHGSKMSVASVEGQGTSFSFPLRLRIGQRLEEPKRSQPPLTGKDCLKGLRILVADDNAVNIFIVMQYLKEWGVHCEAVNNGHEALARLQERSFHLLLLDLRMPGMTGYETARKIRGLTDETFKNLPIIAVSASLQNDWQSNPDADAFSDFIGKPILPQELLNKIIYYCANFLSVADQSHAVTPELMQQASQGNDAAAGHAPVTLQHYQSLTDGDQEALVELLTIVANSIKLTGGEIDLALAGGDEDSYRFLSHRITPTLEMLEAQTLLAALKQATYLLKSEESEAAALLEARSEINKAFDCINIWLATELQKNISDT